MTLRELNDGMAEDEATRKPNLPDGGSPTFSPSQQSARREKAGRGLGAPATRIARRGGLDLMNSMVSGAWIRSAPMMAADELASAGS